MNLHDLDSLRPTALGPEIERRRKSTEPPRPVPEPSRLGRRITAGIVAFAVFGLAVALGSGIIRERTEPAVTNEPWAGYKQGWTELPAPPEWRDGAAIVWTGTELLYWGGTERGGTDAPPLANGFSFDPQRRSWTDIPPAPSPGSGWQAVWTGAAALFYDPDPTGVRAMLFEPTTSTWHRIAVGPKTPRYGSSSAWTGHELILFGGANGDAATSQAWALDPASGTWRQLPDAPIAMNISDAVWANGEMVVVGSARDKLNASTTPTSLAQAFDPSSATWRRLASPPVSGQTAAVAWVDQRLIAWELYSPGAAEYLPNEDRWRSIEMAGLDGGECYASGVTLDQVMFTWNCGAPAAWFGETSTWLSVSPPTKPASPGSGYGFGSAWAAGAAAIVEQVETIQSHGEPYLGSPDAPIHLWEWLPPATPPDTPWQPTGDDAVRIVDSFVGDFFYRYGEPYIPTLATQGVIDSARAGEGDLVPLGRLGWYTRDAARTSDGRFAVRVDFVDADKTVVASEVFIAGPGTAADGRVGQLVILDVRRV